MCVCVYVCYTSLSVACARPAFLLFVVVREFFEWFEGSISCLVLRFSALKTLQIEIEEGVM